MILVTDNNLKPDLINIINTFVQAKTGVFDDYTDIIKKHYIVKIPIFSWEDDEEKLVEMIHTIDGKYNIKRRFRNSPFWFRIVPIEFIRNEYIIEYHIFSINAISHYLTPNIIDYETIIGTYGIYMDKLHYKLPYITQNKIKGMHNFNQKIDIENFGWQEIIYCTQNVKNKMQ